MLTNEYLKRVYEGLEKRNANEPEFLQAVREVLESIQPVVEKHPEYEKAGLIERLVEPERIITFRVPWVARALKKHNPNVYIVAVEPASSPVLEGGKAVSHRIQGIGANFVPGIYDASVVDEVMPVPDDEAIRGGRELASTEGLLVGISSGAAVYAARQLAGRPEFKGKMIVTLLPDTGERYLTTELFAFDAYPLD